MNRQQFIRGLMLSAAGLASRLPARAQGWPAKPVTMIVPSPAGGASDFAARVMVKEIGALLKQTLIVENVSGAAGSLGVNKVLAAAPDGHTVMLGSPIELILTPLAIAAAKYKPTDVRTVFVGGHTPMVLAVRKNLAASSVEELVAAMKKTDPPMSYASSGLGSLYHLLGAKFAQAAGVQALHVPYAGVAPVVQNLSGGHVDFAFLPLAGPVAGALDGGMFRALAITSPEPNPRLPRVPALRSMKGLEDFVFSIWAGIQVHRNVPEEVAVALHKVAYAALTNPEVRKSFESSGITVASPRTLPELAADYQREIAAYQAIARSINLQAQ